MKTLGKAIAAASLAAVSVNAVAVEGLSTTIGAVSDYYFRGDNLGDAGGYASIDYEIAGFFVGVWAIDDGIGGGNNGLETDFYLGYGVDLDGVELGVGYTRYEYTYNTGAQVDPLGTGDDVNTKSQFEHEINLSAAFAGFGLDVALGTAEADHVVSSTGGALSAGTALDTEQDYTYITLSYGSGPYGVLLGSMDKDDVEAGAGVGKISNSDSEYKHIELSYSAEIGTFDVTTTLGQVFDVEEGGVDSSSGGNNYLVFDISKSFDI